MKEFLIIILVLVGSLNLEAENIYEKYFTDHDFSRDDTITLCYESLFFLYLYKEDQNPDLLKKGEDCLSLIIEKQKENGEITNEPNVNPKLYTGIGIWALSLGYEITKKEKYKDSALKGGDFLIDEINAWKKAYPAECPDERNENAKHEGEMRNSLENYCYSCPNDWGLICAGLGSIVYHIREKGEYYNYALLLGDTLYNMQLENGAWYDGYALKIPTRWNISSHYVTMAILGEWICYKITDDQKYRDSLEEALQWMENMQTERGVYDIYIDDQNLISEKDSFAGHPQNKCDFRQIQGQTNVKKYYSSPEETMLGEYSLFLAETLAEDIGIVTNREESFDYIKSKNGYSNWYILSLVLKENEDLESKREDIIKYVLFLIILSGLILWIAKRKI